MVATTKDAIDKLQEDPWKEGDPWSKKQNSAAEEFDIGSHGDEQYQSPSKRRIARRRIFATETPGSRPRRGPFGELADEDEGDCEHAGVLRRREQRKCLDKLMTTMSKIASEEDHQGPGDADKGEQGAAQEGTD